MRGRDDGLCQPKNHNPRLFISHKDFPDASHRYIIVEHRVTMVRMFILLKGGSGRNSTMFRDPCIRSRLRFVMVAHAFGVMLSSWSRHGRFHG